MTLAFIAAEEVVTVKVYKRLTQRQDLLWANTYEMRSASTQGDSGSEVVNRLVQVIVAFERRFHLTDVTFDRAVVSSYVPDGEPYNPETFVSIPLAGLTGLRGVGASQAVPLHMCMLVRRQTEYGRNGRALYRRCLLEDDVQAASGDPTITTAAEPVLNELVQGAYGEPEATFLDQLAVEGWAPVLASGVGVGVPSNVRFVTQQSVAGVVVKKYNNRFFDRA